MATITLRMDDEEKRQLDAALDNIGMNISTFYAIYTKRFLSERRIPFDVAYNDPFYSFENQHAIEEAERQIREGKVVRKTMAELEAMEDG